MTNIIIENILNQIKDCDITMDINNNCIDDDCIAMYMYHNYHYTLYINRYSENNNILLFAFDDYDRTKIHRETIIDLRWDEELNKYIITTTDGFTEDLLRECLEYVNNDDYILWLCRQIK